MYASVEGRVAEGRIAWMGVEVIGGRGDGQGEEGGGGA